MGKTYTIQIHNLIGGRAISGQKALFVLFGLLFSFQMSFGSNVTEHEALTSSFYDTTTYKLLNSTIYEAEDALGDPANITDVVNTNVGLREPDAASKKKVAYIPDPGDKIKIPFTIAADGDFVFFVRLRTGENGSENYTINVDGVAKNFTLINGSISPKSLDLGGSYWSTLEIDDKVALTGANHYIEIEADVNGYFQAVDFVEVGEVDMTGPYIGALPAPGNLTLKELNSTKLNIGWDAVPGVTGYLIEVADNIGGTYTTLETVGRYSIYYQHSGLAEGTSKAYKITALRYGSSSAASDEIGGTTKDIPNDFKNINHVATIGDDLALGFTSEDPSRITVRKNYEFDNGIIAENGTAFSPLPIGGDGGISATAAHFWKAILHTEQSEALLYEDYEIFTSISGASGKKLSEISKGNAAYSKLLNQFSNAETLAGNEGLSYAKRAVYLLQGSADAATDTVTYKNQLSALKVDLEDDLSENIPLVIAQVNEGTVGIAQYNATKENPNIIIATPTYFAEDSEDGRQWIGQYFSKVYDSEIFGTIETWKGLSPKTISRTENTINIEFNVPVAPLTLDTVTVPKQANYGFEIRDKDGVVGIKSVLIFNDVNIVITVKDGETLGSDARVSYALETGKGNLKDSDTQYQDGVLSYKNSSGEYYELNNWAFAFDEDIPNGAPEAPTSLVAIPISDTQIDLSWDDMGAFASEYVIESSTSDSPYNFSVVGTVSTNSYSDTLLTADTQYFYRVMAKNSSQESAYSDTVSATTLPPIPAIPSGLSATALSNTEVQIDWAKLTDNITGYTLEFSEGDDQNFQTVTDTLGANTETYIHSDLTGGVTYYYRLFAKNGESTSDYSDTVNTVTDVPDGPSDLAVTANSSSELAISWGAMTGNVDNYFLESSMSNTGPFTALATIEASDTSFLHINLSADTTVYYRVKAEIDAAPTGYSSAVGGTTFPNAPTNLTASGTSSSEIEISWVSPGGSVSSFVLESADSENGTYSELATIDTANTSYVHDGLSASTTVWYQIKAINAGGASEYSAKDSATTLSPDLDAPTDLVATPFSESQIDIKWNSVDGATSYILQVSDTDVAADFVNLETIDAPDTTYSHTGLDPETTKFYRVKAANASGQSDYSASANATTTADLPAIPGNFKANAISDSDIKLTWDKLTENVDGYIIESGDAEAGPFTQLIALSDTASTYTHSGLAANTQKFYRIKATNGDATSDYSAVVNATTTITGIDDELHFDVFRVFPNPSNGVFQIELNTNRFENGKMTVFNAIGKVVFEKQINSQSAESIDLSNLKKGLYIINVKTSSNHQMKKIILE